MELEQQKKDYFLLKTKKVYKAPSFARRLYTLHFTLCTLLMLKPYQYKPDASIAIRGRLCG